MLCAAFHHAAVGTNLSAIKWSETDYFAGVPHSEPLFCLQCPKPNCYYACPLKDRALCIDSVTGARYINQAECDGCGLCVAACPYDVPRVSVDTDKKKATKCDLCKDRVDGPVCVDVCTVKALTLVGREERE